jgi:hypothetical protein
VLDGDPEGSRRDRVGAGAGRESQATTALDPEPAAPVAEGDQCDVEGGADDGATPPPTKVSTRVSSIVRDLGARMRDAGIVRPRRGRLLRLG